MNIAFVGLGLIGGSIARALRPAARSGPPAARSGPLADLGRVSAWTPSGEGPAAAAAAGIVDVAAPTARAAIAGAGLVIVAIPPLATLAFIEDLAGPLRDALARDAVVTDVASTKATIVERAQAVGLRWVGGHPMAGRETTGYGASDGSLFEGRPWVVVPNGQDDGTRLVEALARACGAVPLRMAAREHDEAVAAVSHLPLIVSAALVEAVAGGLDGGPPGDWPAERRLAASGWADMTRLARGDVAMGAGIAATNAAAIATRIRALRAVLDAWLAELERPEAADAERLAERLRSARDRLEAADPDSAAHESERP